MKLHRPTLKAQARQTMAAARPNAWLMTMVFLLLTIGVPLLINLFFANPLVRLAELLAAALPISRALMLTLSDTGSTGLFLHILVLIVTAVLVFSYDMWCLGSTRGGIGEWRDLFGGFAMAGRAVLLQLAVLLICFILSACALMSTMLLSILAMSAGEVGLLAIMPLFYIAVGFVLWRMLQYSFASYCLMDEPDKGVFHAIGESRRLMRGHCGQFFLLLLSFFGWAMLNVLIQLAADGVVLLIFGGPWLFMRDWQGALLSTAGTPLAGIVSTLLSLPFYAWLFCYTRMSVCRFYNGLRDNDLQQQQQQQV